MQDFFQNVLEKVRKEWRSTLKNFGVKVKEAPKTITEQKSNYEVSLVPEVKRKMIRAIKFKNIMLFVCIILVAMAGGVVVIMGSVWEGQNITMSGQDSRIEKMSKKLNDYDSLSEFLTIQNQLGDLSEINSNKKVLSRVFSILKVLLPEGPDTISLSELAVDLEENTLRFDAQADAKVSPYIDYRVLESFKKGVSLMKYDYGRYVTADGEEIPTRCMVETDENGSTWVETEERGSVTNKYIYAYWLKGEKGCDPGRDDGEEEKQEDETETVTIVDGETGEEETITRPVETKQEVEKVKVYRSPRFAEWYKDGYMTESGTIEGVPHFESKCITYSGENTSSGIKWTSENECMLSAEDPIIRDSSNGRDSENNLVLRFSAILTLDPAVFLFTNKHVMAISPSGQNVTDSYRQIEGMFAERAADCADSDVVCTATATTGGDE